MKSLWERLPAAMLKMEVCISDRGWKPLLQIPIND